MFRTRRRRSNADLARRRLGRISVPRSLPLPTVAVPTPADLLAEAENLAELMVAARATDEFNPDVVDEMFDRMLSDALVALATEADEQLAVDDRIVDEGRAAWVAERARTRDRAAAMERLERLRDHHYHQLTGIPARPPELPRFGDREGS